MFFGSNNIIDVRKMSDLVRYALCFVGKPYRWGGSGPSFDCSGFIQELLAYKGIDPVGDQSAQGLYDYFKAHGRGSIKDVGALVFYGKDDKSITHVEMCMPDDEVIGAMGGGRGTVSDDAAIAHSAFVKMRPLGHRKDIVEIILPDYAE